ncbi:unnamed protein product, partial [Litomosoides sigmodontis]
FPYTGNNPWQYKGYGSKKLDFLLSSGRSSDVAGSKTHGIGLDGIADLKAMIQY